MTPKLIPLLEACIENGARCGVAAAHLDDGNPSREEIVEHVAAAIWEELREWFDFNDAPMARDGDLPRTNERL